VADLAPPPKRKGGWYPDPEGSGRLRFWNKTRWTDDFMDAPGATKEADSTSASEGGSSGSEVTPEQGVPPTAVEETGATYKGTNGILVLRENELVIKRGGRGFLTQGKLRGDKHIRYVDIVGIQFKKAGMTAGYIQFGTKGGHEASGGLRDAIRDENSVSFNSSKNSQRFEEAKAFIERKLDAVHATGESKTCPDCAETVLAAARVCKHCGFRFEAAP
jgi:hypothetical protein